MIDSLWRATTGLFGGWTLHPALAAVGAMAAVLPILVHLLVRRRWRQVQWAAIDFLLRAQRRVRRRVRLENLLLILLRCAAILLLGLLIARPFRSVTGTAGLFESIRTERVVLLDDSLSMQARPTGESAMQQAKTSLVQFVRALAERKSDESLTLLLTSQPDRPLLNATPVTTQTLPSLLDELDRLTTTDQPARLEVALASLGEALEQPTGSVTRVVYLLTDLRQVDWIRQATKTGEEANPLSTSLARVSQQSAGCFLVDVGEGQTANLSIVEVKPQEKSLVAGVATRLDVSVRNDSLHEVGPLEVELTAGASLPVRGEIDSIPAGQTRAASITYTFAPSTENPRVPPAPVPLVFRLLAENLPASDRLTADNTRYYAAQVINGLPTLLVDGDPAADPTAAETFYLESALTAPGEIRSGIVARVVSDAQFDSVSLDDFRVIFLANVYHLSDEQVVRLSEWVRSGGGLVIAPGDLVDEQVYARQLYRHGDGLLPVPLVGVRGDAERRRWVHFDPDTASHPAFRVFSGPANPFAESVKIFRYWQVALPAESEKSAPLTIAARWTDADRSPAMIEKPFGKGRVVLLTTPVDDDWNDWPDDAPSYLITMQELARYLAEGVAGRGNLLAGQPLRLPIATSEFKLDAQLTTPDNRRVPFQAAPVASENETASPTSWQFAYDQTGQAGFYSIELRRLDGSSQTSLWAANANPTESNLARIDPSDLRRQLSDLPVTVVTNEELSSLATDVTRGELTSFVLLAVAIALASEQLLGWWFGRRR